MAAPKGTLSIVLGFFVSGDSCLMVENVLRKGVMMRRGFLILVLMLCSVPAIAGSLKIEAADLSLKVGDSKEQYFASSGVVKSKLNDVNLEDYHIVYITFANEMSMPVTATVGQFSLVTSMKRSVNFTADMYSIARKPWMDIAAFPAAKVMPGTTVSGFIAFEKSANDEMPEVLHFEAADGVLAKTVVAGDENYIAN